MLITVKVVYILLPRLKGPLVLNTFIMQMKSLAFRLKGNHVTDRLYSMRVLDNEVNAGRFVSCAFPYPFPHTAAATDDRTNIARSCPQYR